MKIWKYNIIVQKVEDECLVLITSREDKEGLASLISDKARLANYIRNQRIRPKVFTHQCEIKFKPKK